VLFAFLELSSLTCSKCTSFFFPEVLFFVLLCFFLTLLLPRFYYYYYSVCDVYNQQAKGTFAASFENQEDTYTELFFFLGQENRLLPSRYRLDTLLLSSTPSHPSKKRVRCCWRAPHICLYIRTAIELWKGGRKSFYFPSLITFQVCVCVCVCASTFAFRSLLVLLCLFALS
jgi:hypothetical protein